MMRKNTNILGMTTTQLGILAGLALIACLTIGTLAWLIISASWSGLPDQPAALPTVLSPTPTLTILGPLSPTLTPSPTAPTLATSAPSTGWLEFGTTGVTLWLPSSFVGGDTLHHRSETINAINKLGKYFRNAATGIKNLPPEVVLWIVDKNSVGSSVITTVIVSHIVRSADTSIDQYVQDVMYGTGSGNTTPIPTTVNETKKLTLLGRDARRLVYSQQLTGYDITGVVYFVKDGADFWSIDYNLDPNKYLDMIPMVDQSIHTFNLTQ